MESVLSDGRRDRLVVAGEHDDMNALRLQGADGIGRGWFYLVGDYEVADVLTVDSHAEGGAAGRTQCGDCCLLECSEIQHQRGIADGDPLCVDDAANAFAWDGCELLRLRKLQASFLGGVDDGRR